MTDNKKNKLIITGNEMDKILVIDDDEMHLKMTNAFLEEKFEVTTASSANEALDILQHGYRPNLILLDLEMPEIDGWDTYRLLKGISLLEDVPIVIFSSSSNPEHKELAEKMGAVDFINKPCNKNALAERIEKILHDNDLSSV